jgi:DNA-binding Xre family transcriptional regulator
MWRVRWNVKKFWIGDLELRRVDLADITGIRPGTIGDIINGINNSVSLDDLGKLCYALQRDIGEILTLEKDTEKLEGDELTEFIMGNVQRVREERSREAAERRERENEQRQIEEEQRIQRTVRKILLEHGITPDNDEKIT